MTDSTNADTDYTRNYIRNKVMPLLKEINPCIEKSIQRTARLHSSDERYLSLEAEKNTTDDVLFLSDLNESILSRVVINLFKGVSEEILPELHVREVCRRIYEYDGRKTKVSVSDGFCAVICKGKISFEKDKREKEKRPEFETKTDGNAVFFEENPYCLYISFDENEDIPQTLVNEEIIYKKYTTDYLYFDTIPHVLTVRNRRDGDKIESGKMNKSVKRLMNSSNYTEKERYLVPFVCDGDKILLVPGLAVCDDVKQSTERTKRISVTLYKHNTDTGEWYYLNEK